MARINLRPWREELRVQKQQQFLTALVGFALIGGLYIFLANMVINGWTEDQQGRNTYLSSEIAALDKKIIEIKKLQERKEELIARMKIIQSLQGNRPVIVHFFDEIVRTLPDGIYYESLQRKGDVVSIKGRAESNNRISSLMRRLDGSEWFDEPNLTSVKATAEEDSKANSFDLTVKRRKTKEEQEG